MRDGKVSQEKYFIDGINENLDGASKKTYADNEDNTLEEEVFYRTMPSENDPNIFMPALGGSKGGPGIIEYYPNGRVKSKRWYNNDEYTGTISKEATSNEHGTPAVINYFPNGKIESVYYQVNGVLHNEYGPAQVFFDKEGNIVGENYYFNGFFQEQESLYEDELVEEEEYYKEYEEDQTWR